MSGFFFDRDMGNRHAMDVDKTDDGSNLAENGSTCFKKQTFYIGQPNPFTQEQLIQKVFVLCIMLIWAIFIKLLSYQTFKLKRT